MKSEVEILKLMHDNFHNMILSFKDLQGYLYEKRIISGMEFLAINTYLDNIIPDESSLNSKWSDSERLKWLKLNQNVTQINCSKTEQLKL
jgi:hypothetical protein